MKTLSLTVAMMILVAPSAFADKKEFREKHPRRAEVLGRANHEEAKNNAAAADGKITQQQADKLNKQDQAIKAEEQAQAKENGGYITKQEQRMDNRQENQVNRERRRMERRDAMKANGGNPAAPSTSTPAAPTASAAGQ